MPPRRAPIPRSVLSPYRLNPQSRLPPRRHASVAAIPRPETVPWRRTYDQNTRLGQAITGGMEWQTSAYYWNKHNEKNLPVAASTVQKLIEGYATVRNVNIQNRPQRAIRAAIAARRRTAEKVYVSKPRIKDYGRKVQVTAFLYDAKEAAASARAKQAERFGNKSAPQPKQGQSQVDFLLEEEQTTKLRRIMEQVYKRPVDLKLIKLSKPQLDADILSAVVAQQLKDRRNTPRRVIRDATWRAALPNAQAVSNIIQAKHERRPERFRWDDFTLANTSQTNSSTILDKVALSQVTSVGVEAAGRLTKRLTANRSQRKMARHGATAKEAGPILRGFQKAHVQHGFSGGKRRVGQFGIRVALGHA